MTNWEKYFGTPERAAELLSFTETRREISDAVFAFFPGIEGSWQTLNGDEKISYTLEWLESEADDD